MSDQYAKNLPPPIGEYANLRPKVLPVTSLEAEPGSVGQDTILQLVCEVAFDAIAYEAKFETHRFALSRKATARLYQRLQEILDEQ